MLIATSRHRALRPAAARHGALWLLALVLGACADQGATGGTSGDTAGAELRFPGAHVLMVSVDTLRADRLGCYGYERGTSPALDALAGEAVLFESMYSHSPKTASAHMSLFTGLLPTVHKVRNFSSRLGLGLYEVPGNRLTLPQVLNQSGYHNAAVASGGNLMAEMGFAKGFRGRFQSGMADVSVHVQAALQQLDAGLASGQPTFTFLHTYQVHGPYLPPEPFMSRFAGAPAPTLEPRVTAIADLPAHQQWQAMNRGLPERGVPPFWDGKEGFGQLEADYLSSLYDGEVAYTDSVLGQLFDALKERGVYDDMLIVVLSDHGEEFFEHGSFEHDQLYREHLHVPCLVKLPGGRLGGTRVTGMAGLIDVAPTLLELLELPLPPTLVDGGRDRGESLVPAMLSGRTSNRTLIAERVMFLDSGEYQAALRGEALNVIYDADLVEGAGTLSAHDLAADPAEQTNVFDEHPGARRASEQLLERLGDAHIQRDLLDAVDSGKPIKLGDAEALAEELRGLGYVGGEKRGPPQGTPLDFWPSRDDG